MALAAFNFARWIYELVARGWQLMAAPPPVDEVRVRLHHS